MYYSDLNHAAIDSRLDSRVRLSDRASMRPMCALAVLRTAELRGQAAICYGFASRRSRVRFSQDPPNASCSTTCPLDDGRLLSASLVVARRTQIHPVHDAPASQSLGHVSTAAFGW